MRMASRTILGLAAFVTGTCFAASVQFPGGTLVLPGTSTTGVSFAYPGTLTQTDTIAFVQAGNPCLQIGGTAYCVNGAGVLTVAGAFGELVGSSSSFSGPSGVIPAGTWINGSLLMTISGVGTVQIFPTNAANGLGSPTPPPSLTLPATSLTALGFGAFSQTNPTISFIVADTNFADNGGQFVLSQAQVAQASAPIPALGEWGIVALTGLLAAFGLVRLRRTRAA